MNSAALRFRRDGLSRPRSTGVTPCTAFPSCPLARSSAIALLAGLLACSAGFARSKPVAAARSQARCARGRATAEQTAVFAGGCFWGVEAVFEHVKGVDERDRPATPAATPAPRDYETVSTGRTGHAESVQVIYDPAQVSYGQLLQVYFSVAHDPTQLNRQGPDVGTQYRSAIFTANADAAAQVAKAYIAQLTAAQGASRRRSSRRSSR